MRIRITLNHRNGVKLPINYQYYIQSWIYKVISKADQEFSTWLHDHGYEKDGRKYKLFTFGKLNPARYRIHKQNQLFECQEGPTTLDISFLINDALNHFIFGLFNSEDDVFLGNQKYGAHFQVAQVEVLEQPVFENKMKFRFETGCCIPFQKENDKYPKYLHPLDDSAFSALFFRNLIHKFQSSPITKNAPLPIGKTSISILSTPKSVLVSIKEDDVVKNSKIRGYLFDFEITAPKELIEVGYFSGFGTKGSMGFGLVRTLI